MGGDRCSWQERNRKANLNEQQKDGESSPGGGLCKAGTTEVVEELNRGHRYELRLGLYKGLGSLIQSP